MRKTVLSVVTSCALIAIVPASALAHGHHHKRHHRAHHARVRHESWGGGDQSQGTGQSQDQNAGTVESFTGGVLTIALTNGQTVSGQVTPDTEIECQAADTSGSMSSHDSQGDNNGGDNNGDNNQGDDDQGQGDDDNGNAMCSSADLTPTTVVHEAELKVSSAGAVWDKVELVPQSSQSSQSSGS